MDLLDGGVGVGRTGDVGLDGRDAEGGPMTPEEAAKRMAEQGREVFFFVNVETGRPAAVYSRRDGNIALYDSNAVPVAPATPLRW